MMIASRLGQLEYLRDFLFESLIASKTLCVDSFLQLLLQSPWLRYIPPANWKKACTIRWHQVRPSLSSNPQYRRLNQTRIFYNKSVEIVCLFPHTSMEILAGCERQEEGYA